MPDKQKNAQKPREHKESKGQRKGAKRQRPNEQLLIMMNKGLNHRPKRKAGGFAGKRSLSSDFQLGGSF